MKLKITSAEFPRPVHVIGGSMNHTIRPEHGVEIWAETRLSTDFVFALEPDKAIPRSFPLMSVQDIVWSEDVPAKPVVKAKAKPDGAALG